MAEKFKERIGPASLTALAGRVAAAYPAFPSDRFLARATDGLDALELVERVKQAAAALRSCLPEALPEALEVLVAALPPALPDERGVTDGLALWPVLRVVEDRGASHPVESLAALKEMTRRFSAEFAIRPLIEAHPELVWTTLDGWAADPDQHVRRLCSEGTRPRLPWGRRLSASIADPSRGLALIDRLVDDPAPYVRRSVANHLGDVAKDHPELALATARRWLERHPHRADLVRHGLRGPLKAGVPEALAMFGHARAEVAVRDLAADPVRVAVGEVVTLTATLVAEAGVHARVDVVWSWPAARGGWSSKTFRGDDRELVAGEPWGFRHRLSTRPVSTRPTRPGTHRVHLRVNGADSEPVTFVLAG